MNKSLGKLIAALSVYFCFAVYLYMPHFKHFTKFQYLIIVNICLAALGCYVLSSRWVIGFWARFFAGAIYGFGPFALGLTKFHPIVGLLAAGIAWFFCPAALFCKFRRRWTAMPLLLLPFMAIVLFFQASSHYRFFAVPIQMRLNTTDLTGLLIPLVTAKQGLLVAGFYHVAIAPLIIGFSMLLAARRCGIVIIIAVGLILAFCNPLLNISPIIWLTIPLLCCAIIIGEGMQGLVYASFADRKLVLSVTVVSGVLAIVTLLLATKYFQIFGGFGSQYGMLLVKTAQMYIAGAAATAIIFFMARANSHSHIIRWVLICLVMAIDIFFCAGFVVDNVF